MSYRPKTRLEKILNGQIMKARSGLEAAVQAALERMRPLEVDGAASIDEQTGKLVITINKSAAEVFAAAEKGQNVRYESESNGQHITGIIPMEAFRFANEDGVNYLFKIRGDANATDKLFVSGVIAGDDIVVASEV